MTKEEERQKLKNLILEKAKQGKVVFSTFDGLAVVDLDKFIEQPAEGILYDLNRLPEVVFTWIDDPKWINDYAVSLVITKLKDLLDRAAQLPRGADKSIQSPVACPNCGDRHTVIVCPECGHEW